MIRVGVSMLLVACATAVPFHRAMAQDGGPVDISGTVVDSGTGLPLEGAAVTLQELDVTRLTDSLGAFSFRDLALGTYQLAVRKKGYETVEGSLQVLRNGDMVIRMTPVSEPLSSGASRLDGRVGAIESEKPLAGARVSLKDLGLERITDGEGRFSFTDISPGDQPLVVSLVGYATREDSITIPPGSALTLDIGLAIEPIELAPISVSVARRDLGLELAGFYERRAAASGIFLTQSDIEERKPITTVDLFEQFPGVRVLRHGLNRVVSLTGRRALTLMRGRSDWIDDPFAEPCYPSIWMDGMLIHQASYDDPASLDDLVDPYQITGMEIYQSSARIPVQFNVQGACGVIVIWRR